MRPRVYCTLHGCSRTARYQTNRTHANYCPDHAADLAPYVALHPIEGVTTVPIGAQLVAVIQAGCPPRSTDKSWLSTGTPPDPTGTIEAPPTSRKVSA